MQEITLYTVTDLLLQHNRLKKLLAIIVAVSGSVFMWINSEYLVLNIVFTGLLLALVVILFVWQNNRDKKLKLNKFYIAEDVFINVKTKKGYAKPAGFYVNAEIKFSRNGIYTTNLYEKRESKNPSCDYSAVNFSKPGDKFYLLMIEGKEKEVILKCFNAKYYKISDADFDYADGKYYPKKIREA